MVVSSIDIGTNTIRLLIAKLESNCRLNFLVQQSRIARLGEGFSKSKLLKKSAIERAINILSDYKRIIDGFKCKGVFAVATSATREARNKDEFLDKARQIGIDIKVIDEKMEAELTHLGIIFFLKKVLIDKEWVAFDLGGGSTEFMFSKFTKLIRSFSVPLGVVKLLEKFIRNDPPTEDELKESSKFFINKFQEFNPNRKIDVIVANAGTVTSLAAIDLGLRKYSYEATESYRLKRENIERILDSMMQMTSEERLRSFPILEKGREDVIVVGAYIVKDILDFFSKDYLITTNGSLREGVILRELCNE